ncbi:MAG: hypothetical protein ACI9X0_002639 [Kiritimatiellia bacterium]|jgi:uncharacterized protein (DUF885 family)
MLTPVLFLFALTLNLLAESSFRQTLNDFRTDERYTHRFLDTQYSTSSLAQASAFYTDAASTLQQQKFKALDLQDRVDYLLLSNTIQSELRQIDEQRDLIERHAPFVGFFEASYQLQQVRRFGRVADGARSAESLAAIRTAAQDGRKAFDAFFEGAGNSSTNEAAGTNAVEAVEAVEESISKQEARYLALRLAHQVKHHTGQIKSWYQHYAENQPDFAWWVEAEWDATRKVLEEYEKHLRENKAGVKDPHDAPLLGRSMGAEALEARLREEMIPYTARELIAIAEREMAWCETEMQNVADALDEPDWTNALERVKDATMPPGQQAELVGQYVDEAIAFLKAGELLNVPPVCEAGLGIRMVGKDAQRTLPYALYGGQEVRVAYATRGMTHETMQMSMRGNNLHATRIVIAHEAIPGHHYQGYMASKHRAYRQRFSTPFFVEGWALYWEMRLWDLDYARDVKDRAGMLFWRSHRCARVILTLKYHLGDIEPDAMVDYLVGRIGHERNQATAEVRRYIAPHTGVLYQVSYMIGGLQLKALWRECVKDGRMSEADFHDAVAQQGSIPVALIRAVLLKEKLAEDFVSKWRF